MTTIQSYLRLKAVSNLAGTEPHTTDRRAVVLVARALGRTRKLTTAWAEIQAADVTPDIRSAASDLFRRMVLDLPQYPDTEIANITWPGYPEVPAVDTDDILPMRKRRARNPASRPAPTPALAGAVADLGAYRDRCREDPANR